MASVTNADIQIAATDIKIIDRIAEASGQIKPLSTPPAALTILQYDPSFSALTGPSPTHSLLLSSAETTKNPFFHEACVFLPAHDELYITSNLLQAANSSNYPTILISRIKLHRTDGSTAVHAVDWVKMRPPPGISMPNGGVNHPSGDGILICAQGTTAPGSGGIFEMPRSSPARPLVTNFHGRDFNSPNDVVVARDGAVWFTDPCYASDQDFRPTPRLPCAVYRFDPRTGDCRVVADGLGRPNGIAFAPGGGTVYITDTDVSRGAGNVDLQRAATIYAYDVVEYAGAPFLANRRVFAFATNGFPDGIKCDTQGNVYAGCGDGVEIWNAGGTLIGKIAIGGWCANFCFGREGEMFLCGETRLWRVQLAGTTKGALLGV